MTKPKAYDVTLVVHKIVSYEVAALDYDGAVDAAIKYAEGEFGSKIECDILNMECMGEAYED